VNFTSIEQVHTERERLAAALAQAKALRAAKREHGRVLTGEERATVRGRRGARARLGQLPDLPPPPPPAAPPSGPFSHGRLSH
jgi:hypothetical protein